MLKVIVKDSRKKCPKSFGGYRSLDERVGERKLEKDLRIAQRVIKLRQRNVCIGCNQGHLLEKGE